MIKFKQTGIYLIKERIILDAAEFGNQAEINMYLQQSGEVPLENELDLEKANNNTIAAQILTAHNQTKDSQQLRLKFDALASHDITYVGIVQTARASGLTEFPVPYVLTNCHNSLCAVGGTINEDDHVFGLSAAHKYGGIFVPAHQAVIHQYMREMMTGCGRMILGSDSHTRYGALGTMGIGEGGPELVKQLLKRTYDLNYPEIVAIYLEGKPKHGVGPQDVALALIKSVFKSGLVKNKILEFVGPGIANLSVDYRNGIDVMTTETTCLSSIWSTDEQVAEYYQLHGRPEAYRSLHPGECAYYDSLIQIDLSQIEPMIALPFHPSNVWSIRELNTHGTEILREVEVEAMKQLDQPGLSFNLTQKLINGRLQVDQGVVAGCAGGTYENIVTMSQMLEGSSTGQGDFWLSVYPASQPIFLELMKNQAATKLMTTGVTIRSAFCGPCFGAGDVPAHNGLSIRHTTRNFPNREGSKPTNNQLASVALMDARSIAATALNGGRLTAATEVDYPVTQEAYHFDVTVYQNRVYQGYGAAKPERELKFGPNIADWPEMKSLPENLLLQVASVINDSVTTTDELIPSGETSSFRSNPMRLAEFTLSRKDPGYVARAKSIQSLEQEREKFLAAEINFESISTQLKELFVLLSSLEQNNQEKISQLIKNTGLGSIIFARKPGDGSAREQAASCQKVLGGWANLAGEYATKRYRSNLINWGMLPLTLSEKCELNLKIGELIYLPGIRTAIESGAEVVAVVIFGLDGKQRSTELCLANLAAEDRAIILAGCLINYYALGM